MKVWNCYETPEEKRANFPTVTIPLIFEMAWRGRETVQAWLTDHGMDNVPSGIPQLEALHNLTRQGRYVTPEKLNCDPPQPVEITIKNGGDCDQWASVTMAGMWAMGFNPVLVTFGDYHDQFQHVATATYFEHWWLLDPKGDSFGRDFNDWHNGYDDFKIWGPSEFGY